MKGLFFWNNLNSFPKPSTVILIIKLIATYCRKLHKSKNKKEGKEEKMKKGEGRKEGREERGKERGPKKQNKGKKKL